MIPYKKLLLNLYKNDYEIFSIDVVAPFKLQSLYTPNSFNIHVKCIKVRVSHSVVVSMILTQVQQK